MALSHDKYVSKQTSEAGQEIALQVDVSVDNSAKNSAEAVCLASIKHSSVCDGRHMATVVSKDMDMASHTPLLECPVCNFTTHPSDEYVLQLHFEQVHTTDSPFRIENDPEPLPPSLPPRPSSKRPKYNAGPNTPSPDEEEGDSVLCPEPECGESVLLTDFNDHLDYHGAETLSFDETTGQYHSKKLANMHAASASSRPHGSLKPSFVEQNFNTDLPDALRRKGDVDHRKPKKKRGRSDTVSSEKSTLSRSILSFNPFARPDRKVKLPLGNCRLGVSLLYLHSPYLHSLITPSALNSGPMPGKPACRDGCTTSLPPVLRSPS